MADTRTTPLAGFQAEHWLAAIAVLVTTIPFRWVASADAGEQEANNPWIYGAYLALLVLLLLRNRNSVLQTLGTNILGPLLLLVCLSALWSEAPVVTLQKWLSLLVTTLFGGYLAARFDEEKRFQVIALALSLASIGSVIVSLALPAYGIMSGYHQGEWCGIYNHKNVLGEVACVGVLSLLVIAWTTSSWLVSRLCWVGILLDGFLLVMSRSQTSMVVCGVGALLLPTLWLLRQRGLGGVWALCLLTVGAVAIIMGLTSNQDIVLQALGRDVTLTGRAQLWQDVLRAIELRPLLGFGYGVFWQSGEGQAGLVFSPWGSPIAYSHNGALELLLDVGVVGLLLFFCGFLVALVRAFRRAAPSANVYVQWPFVYVTVFFLFNLTEVSIIAHRNLLWVLYVAAIHPAWAHSREKLAGEVSARSSRLISV